jgi:hypothetical protein
MDPSTNLGRSVSHTNFGIVVKKLQDGWAQAKEILAVARQRMDAGAPVSPIIPITTSVGISPSSSSSSSTSPLSSTSLSPNEAEQESVLSTMDLSRMVAAMFHDTIELFGRGRALFGPGGRPDVSSHDHLFNTRGKKLEIAAIQTDGNQQAQQVADDPFFPVHSLLPNAPQYAIQAQAPPAASSAASTAAPATSPPPVVATATGPAPPALSPNAGLLPSSRRQNNRGACVTFSNAVTSRRDSAPSSAATSPAHSPERIPGSSPTYHRYTPSGSSPAPLPPAATSPSMYRDIPRAPVVSPSQQSVTTQAPRREAKRERSCWNALMQMSSQSDREDAEREQRKKDEEAKTGGTSVSSVPLSSSAATSTTSTAVSPASGGVGSTDALMRQLQEARSLAIRLQEENKALKALKNRVEAQNADLLNLREVDTWHAQVALLNQRRGLMQGGYSPATPTYAIGATLSPSIGNNTQSVTASANQYLLRQSSASPGPASPPYSPFNSYPHSPPPTYPYSPAYPTASSLAASTSVSTNGGSGTSHNTMLIHHSASMSPLIAARTLYTPSAGSAHATPTHAHTIAAGDGNGYH